MQLKWVAQHVIQDTYYGTLEPMMLRSGMSSKNRLLTDLIVHVAASVQHCSNKLLTPFVQMINSPEKLNVPMINFTNGHSLHTINVQIKTGLE